MATEVATLLFEADIRGLQAANDELDKLKKHGIKAQDSAKKMGTELKRAANDSVGPLQKVGNSVSALQSAVIALVSVLGVRQLVGMTDQWTDLNSRLVNATGSMEGAQQAMEAISQTAQRTYSSLQQTAQGFLQNNLVLSELGYSTTEQLGLMDALNNSLVISGAKGEQAAMIMGAFGRAMAEGSLKGQELNLMMTYSSRTVQALADGLGVTTIELKRMVAAGEIDALRMFTALTSQMTVLAAEAENMPATIGDAMVQLGNLSLEALGKLDQAAGLSASIADVITRSIAGWRAALVPTEQQRFNELLAQRVALEQELEALGNRAGLLAKRRREEAQAEFDSVTSQMMEIQDAVVARQTAESEAQAAGIAQRAEAEALRVTDHQAELARIEAEKQARIEADREARRLIGQMSAGGKAGGLGGIPDEIERKRAEQEELLRMTRTWQEQMNAEGIAADQARVDASAQQTEQLISFQNMILANKSETSRAAATIGLNLMNQEKREAAAKIIRDSYAAAMGAWRALSVIPIIGPALGAAAAGGILAAGVSYSAKSLAGRALGGQTLAGESYVVGERGPEVLTMGSTNGKIIPNSALSKGGAAATVSKTANVNFTIMANDSRGFDELLKTRRGQIIEIVNQALNDSGQGALV